MTLVDALLAGYGGTSHLAPLTGTTHVSVIDGDGNAAALSSTLGSGSGVFAGGFQLNNMLGELDVIGTEDRHPGDRLPSMMTPTLVLDGDAPRLVVGSAGSVRLAGAILQTIYHVVAGGGSVSEAIDHARLHVEDGVVQIEGGWPEDAAERLQQAGYQANEWAGRNLYFGGVSAVERLPGRRARGRRRSTAWRSWDRRPVIGIRRAEPGDAQALVELAGEVSGEEGAWLLTTAAWRSVTDERRYLRAVRRHPDAAVYVATDGDSLVGRLSLARDLPPGEQPRRRPRPDGGGDATVGAASVEPCSTRPSRGRKAPASGSSSSTSCRGTRRRSPSTTSFGFEREGLRKGHYLRGGAPVDAILMAFQLDDVS